MEDPLNSIFHYQESSEELRQKLLATTLELETMRKMKAELLNLLKMAYRERDEAREQLQKLVKKLVPPITSNAFVDFAPESLVTYPTKANSSITESNSPQHVSSPVDSLMEAVSSPDLSNMNVVDSRNFLNKYLVQNSSGSPSPALVSSEKPKFDFASAVIDSIAKGKALPQKGKLLEAVIHAGGLLNTALIAGPMPTWRNSPLEQTNKIPPLLVHQDFGSNANTFQKPTPQSSHSSHPLFMLNNIGSTNNAWQLTSNVSCKNHTPSRISQSHQYFL